MKEMYKGVVNSPETTITNNISATDTIIFVLDDTRLPDQIPNLMVLGGGISAETVKVVSVEGNKLTVIRGFQGSAKSWSSGTIIARNFTEYDYDAMTSNIAQLDRHKTDIQILEEGAPHSGDDKTIYFRITDRQYYTGGNEIVVSPGMGIRKVK